MIPNRFLYIDQYHYFVYFVYFVDIIKIEYKHVFYNYILFIPGMLEYKKQRIFKKLTITLLTSPVCVLIYILTIFFVLPMCTHTIYDYFREHDTDPKSIHNRSYILWVIIFWIVVIIIISITVLLGLFLWEMFQATYESLKNTYINAIKEEV